MWDKIVSIILRNRLLILFVVLVLSVFMGYKARQVEINYNIFQSLPDNDSTLIQYKEFKKTFGEDGVLLALGINDIKILDLDYYNSWYDLTHELTTVNGVDSVISITNVYGLKKTDGGRKIGLDNFVKQKPVSQNDLDSVMDIIHEQPFYQDFLFIKTDTSYTTIMAVLMNDSLFASKDRIPFIETIHEKAEEFSANTGIEVHYSGLPYLMTRSMQKIAYEIPFFIYLAIIIIAVILYLFFRSFKVVIISLVVVGIAALWVFGAVKILGFKITVLTGIIAPVIIVIGIPNCIFLINKYHLEYKRHRNKAKALSRAINKIGKVILMTNVTTATGFAAFILTNSTILVEFGVVASLNIMVTFILSLLLIPIFLSFVAPPSTKHTRHLDNQIIRKTVAKIIRWVIDHRPIVYTVTAVVLLLAFYGLSRIKAIGNMVDDIPRSDKVYQDLLFFESKVKGTLPFEIQIDTKKENGVFEKNFRTIYKINKLQKELMKDSIIGLNFAEPISIVKGIKFGYQAYKNGNPKFFRLPHPIEVVKLKRFLNNSDQEGINLSSYIDNQNQITRISLQMANIGTDKMFELRERMIPIINDIFDPAEYDVTITGSSMVFLKGTGFLIRNLFLSLGLAIVVIAIFMAIMFNSFRMAIITLIPNLIPLIITGAIMGYFRVHLKPSTILVFSIAFGISVDGSIHYLAKFKQEFSSNKFNIRKSVIMTLRETGISLIYTSIILFFGFAVFGTSTFGGTKAVGILVSTTLLVAMMTNLVLLPSLLLTLEKYLIVKKKGVKL